MENEDKVYKAEELYFCLEDEQVDFKMTPGIAVFIGIKDEQIEMDGGYTGGHNVDHAMLERCGISHCELMEGYFELLDGYEVEDVKKALIAEGMEYKEIGELNKEEE